MEPSLRGQALQLGRALTGWLKGVSEKHCTSLFCLRLVSEAQWLLTLKLRDFGGRKSGQENQPENLFKEMSICMRTERITTVCRDQAMFITFTDTLSFSLYFSLTKTIFKN